jgi:UDP-glucose 4-epimerase
MPRVLITGVAGLLGSHLSEKFLDQGWEVRGIDNLLGGYLENVPPAVELHRIDLVNLDAIAPCFEDVDLVVHAACTAYEGLSVFSPALIVQNTLQITATTLSAAVSNKVKKYVFMSSMARYGSQETIPFTEDLVPNPQDPYGIAKYGAELLVKNLSETHGMDFCILVPHNIIGPKQKYDDPYRNVASIMINRILHGKAPIIYGDGEQMRCFSFVSDVVDPLYVACVDDGTNGLVINIGPDEEMISINHLARRIMKLMEVNFEPLYVPDRPQEVRIANCSANLARKLLGYKTSKSLDDGLRDLITWIRSSEKREFNYHLPIEIQNEKTPRTWTEKMM